MWILGTGIGTLTDDEGRFRLAGLPPGRYRLLVGARDHREGVQTVDVAAGGTGGVSVVLETLDADLERRARALSEQAGSTGGRAGFRERMGSGFGERVTRIEIDAANTQRLSEVIRTYTSAQVEPCSKRGAGVATDCYWVVTGTRLRVTAGDAFASPAEAAVASPPEAEQGSNPLARSGLASTPHESAGKPCVADVYLDGSRVDQQAHPNGIDLVPSSQLEAIEIYKRGALAPPRFRSVGGCGVVLLWSRRAGGGASD